MLLKLDRGGIQQRRPHLRGVSANKSGDVGCAGVAIQRDRKRQTAPASQGLKKGAAAALNLFRPAGANPLTGAQQTSADFTPATYRFVALLRAYPRRCCRRVALLAKASHLLARVAALPLMAARARPAAPSTPGVALLRCRDQR